MVELNACSLRAYYFAYYDMGCREAGFYPGTMEQKELAFDTFSLFEKNLNFWDKTPINITVLLCNGIVFKNFVKDHAAQYCALHPPKSYLKPEFAFRLHLKKLQDSERAPLPSTNDLKLSSIKNQYTFADMARGLFYLYIENIKHQYSFLDPKLIVTLGQDVHIPKRIKSAPLHRGTPFVLSSFSLGNSIIYTRSLLSVLF